MKLAEDFVNIMVKVGVNKDSITVTEENGVTQVMLYLAGDSGYVYQVNVDFLNAEGDVDVYVRKFLEKFNNNNKLSVLEVLNNLNYYYKNICFYYLGDDKDGMISLRISDKTNNDVSVVNSMLLGCINVADKELSKFE